VQERRSITVDVAQRLSRILGNHPRFWLNMQQAVNLWDTAVEKRTEYEKLKPLKVA